MRRIASLVLAGALALGATAPAFADPPRRHDREWNDRRDRDWDRNDRRDRDWRDDRRGDRREWRDDRRNYRDGYRDGRYNTRYYWKRGDHFDRRVHTRYVVINDYNNYYDNYGYRLRAPRYGERYYRDNDTGEILLIAAATGLVLWALNN